MIGSWPLLLEFFLVNDIFIMLYKYFLNRLVQEYFCTVQFVYRALNLYFSESPHFIKDGPSESEGL